MAITRASLENDFMMATQKIDIDPSLPYSMVKMEAPKTFIIKNDYAYAYGPDGFIWMADVLRDASGEVTGINWFDAGNLHFHLEYMYGELYKLRMNDEQIFIMMSAHALLARELMAAFLAAP